MVLLHNRIYCKIIDHDGMGRAGGRGVEEFPSKSVCLGLQTYFKVAMLNSLSKDS